ncbi:hypothetical protein K7I13_05405 [Brucepastera parasyntrophica]|uniref:hypothetical protein n=1 Tax=Brucepastera parasyntrophica TaxID=2880008 RepID=UPI00210CA87A|nr:hypothetical protein [Brucepastera parasyntrophica]ULQ60709.1 hypothetical protein K7I13_05405 [Brucepastera parasyntrophica]
MVSNIGPLRTLSYSMINTVSSGGRTHIPVNPNQYMYSQFQYVSGVPAAKGENGVSIDKLRILNTLIENLVSMKQKNIHPEISSQGEMSDGQIDALIKQYQTQIKNAVAAAENLTYKPVMPQTGAVLNFTV